MSQLESVDVQRLRWFVAVAEELHFARAAKSLNISRQKLSNTVIDLENELGFKLFVPGASPTQLTDAGRDTMVEARRLIAEHEEREAEQRRAELELAIANAARVLRVGFVPGVTVSKWSRIWAERFPDVPLDVVGLRADDQQAALREHRVDMAFVRLPFDRDGMSAIPLYREVPVVVTPKEHLAAAFDQLTLADLADEQLHNATDIDAIGDTIELVAAGVGVVIVPQSIARLHARRDLVYRTVSNAPDTEIVLAWPSDRTTDLVEEFIGVVRGRSERSTRTPTRAAEPSKKAPRTQGSTKPTAKGGPQARRKAGTRRGKSSR